MEADCTAHVRRCHQWQVHGDLKHLPPMPLHTMTSPWPFSTWGIDIIGQIHPTASNGHEFILIAIDYFTKWVEAALYKVLNSKKVTQFIHTNIIYRYGVPHEIISDNGLHFKGETKKLLQQFNIQHHKSWPYRPQTNGAVEAANKNIGWILKKRTKNYKIGTYSCPIHFRGIEHQFNLPQEPLLIHWCMGWKQYFPLRWMSVH